MKKSYFWIIILLIAACCTEIESQKADWLIDDSPYKAAVEENNGSVTISNGLISRTFSLSPDGATTDF